MSQAELLLNMLKGLRLSLLAAVQAIDNILELAQQPSSEQPDAPQTCRHPPQARIPNASMGHPNRFRCQDCGEDVEG